MEEEEEEEVVVVVVAAVVVIAAVAPAICSWSRWRVSELRDGLEYSGWNVFVLGEQSRPVCMEAVSLDHENAEIVRQRLTKVSPRWIRA